jgi:hypothetical protein
MTDLFAAKKEDYGDDYKEHLLEQYKLYVGSVEKTSDRRQSANNYFMAINTALVSLIGLSFQIKFFDDSLWIKLILTIVGVIISVVFWYLIRSYKQLNTGKFAVLHEIEEKLPLALYKHEWKVLGSGKDNDKYYPFSHIELYIPWIFGLIYLIIALAIFCLR